MCILFLELSFNVEILSVFCSVYFGHIGALSLLEFAFESLIKHSYNTDVNLRCAINLNLSITKPTYDYLNMYTNSQNSCIDRPCCKRILTRR